MAVFFSFSRGVRNGKKISTRLQKLLGLPIDYWITFGLPGEFQDYEWITKIIVNLLNPGLQITEFFQDYWIIPILSFGLLDYQRVSTPEITSPLRTPRFLLSLFACVKSD
uniref:Uncharacterized protein n=1 Tax=Amphimedon queenslandica TaxID=400682 RepID=A0A1X7TVK6_AMPQE